MNQFSRERVKGFLHTDGTRMVNGDGEPIVLRGWGVGCWMNPEGFMIGGVPLFTEVGTFEDFALPRRFERGRTMESTVRELCGTAYAKEFARRWYREYLQEEDIRLMAEMGYNSVRLPVSARLFLEEEPEIRWIEEGFAVVDQVLDWCEKYRIYAILDMHGAPGGQSALACDDGIDNRPHMFMEPESRERTILLWEEFARRYADRWIVGGYDLINEPLSGPDCRRLIPELGKFYEELIPRIRKIDTKHMLTLEGAVFSMDMDIFDHDYDPRWHNWCIHIHYYGFSPQARDLYRFLDASLRCQVPIWIGEGGSDPVSNSIFYEIAAAYDIGYALWSWKKADDPKGDGRAAVSYPLPDNWDVMREFIRNGGPRPSYRESRKIFDEMLEKMKPENYTIDWTYNRYNLRQPGIRLPGVGFDEGSQTAGGWRFGNAFGYRTETGMKMPLRPGVLPPQRVVVPTGEKLRESDPLRDLCLELGEGEQVSYTIRDVKDSCLVRICGRDMESGKLQVICEDPEGKKEVSETLLAGAGRSLTESSSGTAVQVQAAKAEWQKITVRVISGCVQIDEVEFVRQENR